MNLLAKSALYGVGICTVVAAILTATHRPKASLALQEWHFEFAEVRAYRVNWDHEYSHDSIITDKVLNETRLPREGIVLSARQVEVLRLATMRERLDEGIVSCHYPHHGFVFYDVGKNVVGHFSVCFLCGTAGGQPNGFADSTDFDILKRLLKDLGLPLENPQWGEQD